MMEILGVLTELEAVNDGIHRVIHPQSISEIGLLERSMVAIKRLIDEYKLSNIEWDRKVNLIQYQNDREINKLKEDIKILKLRLGE